MKPASGSGQHWSWNGPRRSWPRWRCPDLADVVIVDVLETVAAGASTGPGLVGGATLRRLGKAPLSGSPVADVLAPLGQLCHSRLPPPTPKPSFSSSPS